MPQVTSHAPDFKATAVIGDSFKEIKLSDYKGKWVVLFFYPLDFTFVCPTEIIEYDAKLEDFKKIGAEVLGVSVDSEFSHLAWKKLPEKKVVLERSNTHSSLIKQKKLQSLLEFLSSRALMQVSHFEEPLSLIQRESFAKQLLTTYQ